MGPENGLSPKDLGIETVAEVEENKEFKVGEYAIVVDEESGIAGDVGIVTKISTKGIKVNLEVSGEQIFSRKKVIPAGKDEKLAIEKAMDVMRKYRVNIEKMVKEEMNEN